MEELFEQEQPKGIEFPVIIKYKKCKGVSVYYENQSCLMIHTTYNTATYSFNRHTNNGSYEEYVRMIERMINVHSIGDETDYKVAVELFEELKNKFMNSEFDANFSQDEIEETGKIKYKNLDANGRQMF